MHVPLVLSSVVLIVLVALALVVLKAVWATAVTIAEQQRDPSPSTPWLLMAALGVTFGGLACLAWVTQASGLT